MSNPSNSNRYGLRTRTGCWTCRGRSVKCDERHPVCRRCEKAGYTCQYGIRLQWQDESEFRGVCHGRQKNKSKMLPDRSQCRPSVKTRNLQASLMRSHSQIYFINTTYWDLKSYWENQESRGQQLVGSCCAGHETASLLAAKDYTEPCPIEDSAVELNDVVPAERSQLLPPLASGLIASLDQADGYILRYYDSVVCSNASLLDDPIHNPVRYVFLPLAVSSPTILRAILALGAGKLAHLEPSYRCRALERRLQVLTDLKHSIHRVHNDRTSSIEAVAAVLVMCWIDISDLCRPSWTHHLAGLSALLEICLKQGFRSSYDEKLFKYCRQYLIYHLIIAKATFPTDYTLPDIKSTLIRLSFLRTDPSDITPAVQIDTTVDGSLKDCIGSSSEGISIRDNGLLPGEDPTISLGDLNCVETHQGFSNALLFLINDICDLNARAAAAAECNENELVTEMIQLEQRLMRLQQCPPHVLGQATAATNDPCAPADRSTNAEWSERMSLLITAHAEANRSAALLILHESCLLHLAKYHPRLKSVRSELVEDIIAFTEIICSIGTITAALPIWAVFVAGCVVAESQQRRRILEIMDEFQSSKRFGSIPPAYTVMEMVWRQNDLKADENPRKARATPCVGESQAGSGHSHDFDKIKDFPTRGKKSFVNIKPARFPWEHATCIAGGLRVSLT